MKKSIKVSVASLVLLGVALSLTGSASADMIRTVRCNDGSTVQAGGTVSNQMACGFKNYRKASKFVRPTLPSSSVKRVPQRTNGYTPIGRAPLGQGMVEVPPPIEEVKPGTAEFAPAAWAAGVAAGWAIKKGLDAVVAAYPTGGTPPPPRGSGQLVPLDGHK